jgi:hypothetical protein
MSFPIHRQRTLLGEDLIGYIIAHGDGWNAAPRSGADDHHYPTANAAEDALRESADQTTGRRILTACFLAALVGHPVLFAVTRVF